MYPFVVTVKPAARSSNALKSAYSTAEAFCGALAAMETVSVHIDLNEANEIRLYVLPFHDVIALAKHQLSMAWKNVGHIHER